MKTKQTKTVKDNLGRWLVVTDGVADKFNFFATKKDALEFVRAEAGRRMRQ